MLERYAVFVLLWFSRKALRGRGVLMFVDKVGVLAQRTRGSSSGEDLAPLVGPIHLLLAHDEEPGFSSKGGLFLRVDTLEALFNTMAHAGIVEFTPVGGSPTAYCEYSASRAYVSRAKLAVSRARTPTRATFPSPR